VVQEEVRETLQHGEIAMPTVTGLIALLAVLAIATWAILRAGR
jgi:hypothetical protein